MRKESKSRRILMLLAEGCTTAEICSRVGCTKALVSIVRCHGYVSQARRHRPYQKADEISSAVRVEIGPWSRDAEGNLSREIRGI